MSDKNKNENKNVIEKLLDSVITYSQSNMGPNEQILTQIATSPDWEIHGVKSSIDTAKNEEKVVQRAVNDLSNPKVFAGKTASAAADYGRSIVNIQYAQKLEDQTDAIEKRIKSANKVLEYVRNNQDNLPGNKLDDASSFAIRAAAVGATIFLPVSLPVGAAVAGGVTVGIASGWLDPVAKSNDLLEKNREAEAKKLLEEEVIPMFKRLNSTESVPSAVSKPGDVQDIGSTDVDIWDQSGVDGRVLGPGTYLGDGAYDLNGDGLPDYYDYNMDGVPDVWVDSDGDGIPDIYDTYDPDDAAQNRKYAEAVDQISRNRRTSPHNNDQGGNGSGGQDVDDRPGYVVPDDSNDPYDPSIPIPSRKPTDNGVVDVDSDLDLSPVPVVPRPSVSASGLGGSSAGLGAGASLGGVGGAGLALGGAGVGIGAGVSGGSFFTNAPVHAQVVPGGISGATGMAAGLKSAGAASGAAASAGRPGMMGAPGAAGSNRSKNKRQGLGYMAPKLEDDDIAIRSVGAMAGHRARPAGD